VLKKVKTAPAFFYLSVQGYLVAPSLSVLLWFGFFFWECSMRCGCWFGSRPRNLLPST
jgi:hypothetical protein